MTGLPQGYMREAFALVRDAGGVAIADEVQTGFNRCGETFWGFEMKHNDCVPDIVTVAKVFRPERGSASTMPPACGCGP